MDKAVSIALLVCGFVNLTAMLFVSDIETKITTGVLAIMCLQLANCREFGK
jgi:hypothetical protein